MIHKAPVKEINRKSQSSIWIFSDFLNLIFSVLLGFLLETDGSDLSRQVREAVPVHLVLVWSKSDGRRPSYGQKTGIAIFIIWFFLFFASRSRILLFFTSKSNSTRRNLHGGDPMSGNLKVESKTY